MRIVSLVPSATEILFALGLDDEIIGVTHECDHPPAARKKSIVVRSLLDPSLPSRAVDAEVMERVHARQPLYGIDAPRMAELAPDLVVTQGLCDVCAVPTEEVDACLRVLPGRAQVVDLNPRTLEDVLNDIERLGAVTGRKAEALELVEGLRARVNSVKARASGAGNCPRVFCMEWLDPPFNAGHWIPEMVSLAGGREVVGQGGLPSRRVTLKEVLTASPEVIILMPCGHDIPRARQELERLRGQAWDGAGILLGRKVFVGDGNAHFSRPGPRLVEGLEILARILHPELFPLPAASPWTYQGV